MRGTKQTISTNHHCFLFRSTPPGRKVGLIAARRTGLIRGGRKEKLAEKE